MTSALKKTPLYDLHVARGAKMAAFAGYDMPINYAPGIVKEHLHAREKCGLFDVSHMGVIEARAKNHDIARHLETLMPMDLQGLAEGRQRYALLTNDNGGVRDDLMVSRLPDRFVLVVNAACKHDDYAWLASQLGDDLQLDLRDDLALLALQGPAAGDVMRRLGAPIDNMTFMQVAEMDIQGQHCLVSRSGYTGEDGFEIALSANAALAFAERALADEAVALVGLGARDTLRLEAGLCLYGHELDADTTPVEAGLNWALSKARRADAARAGNFPGAKTIHAQFPRAARTLVGLAPQGRAPVRDGAAIFADDEKIGVVTSGGFSPSLGRPICLASIKTDYAEIDRDLNAEVRGKKIPVRVVRLPFVAHRYAR